MKKNSVFGFDINVYKPQQSKFTFSVMKDSFMTKPRKKDKKAVTDRS